MVLQVFKDLFRLLVILVSNVGGYIFLVQTDKNAAGASAFPAQSPNATNLNVVNTAPHTEISSTLNVVQANTAHRANVVANTSMITRDLSSNGHYEFDDEFAQFLDSAAWDPANRYSFDAINISCLSPFDFNMSEWVLEEPL